MTNTNNEKKATQKELFTAMIAVLSNSNHALKDEMIALCESKIDSIEARKVSSAKASAEKKENNNVLADLVYNLMATIDKPVTCTELFTAVRASNDVRLLEITSPQKTSYLLRSLVNAERVKKEYVAKVAYFSLAE